MHQNQPKPTHQSRREFLRRCALGGIFCGSAAMLGTGCGRPAGIGARIPVATADPPGGGKDSWEPAYLRLHRSGELARRAAQLHSMMSPCALCPRECGVDRAAGVKGFCQAGGELMVASHHPHFGEEPPLVGRGGSGTIFFSHCGLRCVFCINYDVSMEGRGDPCTVEQLAAMMLRLQAAGCHNINVVTPSHYSPYIVSALDLAAEQGLRLPLVYNCCGWEQMDVLRLLDGVVDIYLPDFKYFCGEMAAKYSSYAPPDPRFGPDAAGVRFSTTETYPELTKTALLEMHRQVGVAKPDSDGLVRRGLMLRHLVMPNDVGGSTEVVRWIAENLPKETYLNLMSQYTPMFKAGDFPQIARRITTGEYREVVAAAQEAGLVNLDIQGYRRW